MRKLLLLLAGILCLSIVGVLPARAYAADNGSIVVQSIPGPSVGQKITARAKGSWPWYVTRGSGLVAAATLIVLILSGIGQVTGYTFRFLDPLTSWASHRALGLAFGVAVLLHVFSLLFDHFVTFKVADLLVPWLSHYKPVTLLGLHLGSLYVALGVLSLYLVIVVVVTSLLWVEKKPHTWKWIHLLSYVLISFVFVHALFIGTDLAHGIFRLLWIGCGAAVVVASLHRLWRLRNL